MKKRHQQPRIEGMTRLPGYSGLLPTLKKAVDREAARWNVTPSYVIATCVSFALNVEEQPDYRGDNRSARVLTSTRFAHRKLKATG